MFTGIVREMGVVKSIELSGVLNRIRIECSEVAREVKMGDSVSVNGICLTVSAYGNSWFEADVMPETLRKTNLSDLNVGGRVNLEPALRLEDRLGGHIVSGHIDGIGVIKQIKNEKNAVWIIIEAPQEIARYIVMKGSVAVDGTSLTVAYVEGSSFGVSLIPATRSFTTLGTKKVGDKVNVECDIIGKYIEKLIKPDNQDAEQKTGGIDMAFLEQKGFI